MSLFLSMLYVHFIYLLINNLNNDRKNKAKCWDSKSCGEEISISVACSRAKSKQSSTQDGRPPYLNGVKGKETANSGFIIAECKSTYLNLQRRATKKIEISSLYSKKILSSEKGFAGMKATFRVTLCPMFLQLNFWRDKLDQLKIVPGQVHP